MPGDPQIEHLIDRLPAAEALLTNVLRDFVWEVLPAARERLSWGAPFYFHHRAVCFIWPASVPWGRVEEGVALGFPAAARMDHGGYLAMEGRKQVGRRVFRGPEEVDLLRVEELLLHAWELGAK